MRISYHWLKDFIPNIPSPEEVSTLLTSCGLEVESLEHFESIRGSLEGLVVGRVLTCEKHPNADKLKLTTVDVGHSTLPIVCGAANVAEGQYVIVALAGAKLFPTQGEPFVIQKSKIRGEVSEGMICAEDEIGLGDSHSGIIVLDKEYTVGTPAANIFEPYQDFVFEIGLTPNRGDAASHLGVAYDLAALLGQKLELPVFQNIPSVTQLLPLEIEIENPAWCPRYCGLVLDNITVQPSPTPIANRLKAIGISPINNIVDITNYILHGYGQPMHAFDYEAIAGQKVIIGKSHEQTSSLKTLDGVERKIHSEDLLIKNELEPMCFAGVFGGEASGVSATTKRIFLESAFFNSTEVRKTSQRHGLKTDASFRFERGTDIEFPPLALHAAYSLLFKSSPNIIVSAFKDKYPQPLPPRVIEINLERINRLLGVEIPQQRALEILNNLHLECIEQNFPIIKVKIPYRRTDLIQEADIAEELLRIFGFDHIPLSAHNGTAFLSDFGKKSFTELQNKCNEVLISRGFYEIMTNSLISDSEASAYSTTDLTSIKLLNPLSEEINTLRNSLLPSMLSIASYNLNRKQKDLKLFEWGKIYNIGQGTYKESTQLAIVLSGSVQHESWQHKEEKVTYHTLQNIISSVLERLGILHSDLVRETSDQLEPMVSFMQGEEKVASMGKVKRPLLKKYDIKQEIWFASLSIPVLMNIQNQPVHIKEPEKYPAVRRDLSLVIDQKVCFSDIVALSKKVEDTLLKEVNLFDTFMGAQVGEGKKSYSLSFTLSNEEKTLTDNEIEAVMDRLIKSFETEIGALIRR